MTTPTHHTLATIFIGCLILALGCQQSEPEVAGSPPNATPAHDRSARGFSHEEPAVDIAPTRIVAFGDSLTAGAGIPVEQSYPSQLQRRLDDAGYRVRVINAGVSGDTTAGGLRRVDWVLKSNPDIVILELGANDGLRGLPTDEMRANLDHIIQRLTARGIRVLLTGMKLPLNYGEEYRARFEAVYQELARRHPVAFIPFFLDGVGGEATLNQADGIHPTAEGYQVIVERLWPILEPLIEEVRGRRDDAAAPGGSVAVKTS